MFRMLILPFNFNLKDAFLQAVVAAPSGYSWHYILKIVFQLQEGLCCHSSKYFMCSLGGSGGGPAAVGGCFGALQLPEALIVSLCGPGASFLSCAVSSACRPQ